MVLKTKPNRVVQSGTRHRINPIKTKKFDNSTMKTEKPRTRPISKNLIVLVFKTMRIRNMVRNSRALNGHKHISPCVMLTYAKWIDL